MNVDNTVKETAKEIIKGKSNMDKAIESLAKEIIKSIKKLTTN